MQNLKLTLAAGVITPFVSKQQIGNAPCPQTLIVQNNTAFTVWIGGPDVAANNGIQLAPNGSVTAPLGVDYAGSLSDWYAICASTAFLNILLLG